MAQVRGHGGAKLRQQRLLGQLAEGASGLQVKGGKKVYHLQSGSSSSVDQVEGGLGSTFGRRLFGVSWAWGNGRQIEFDAKAPKPPCYQRAFISKAET